MEMERVLVDNDALRKVFDLIISEKDEKVKAQMIETAYDFLAKMKARQDYNEDAARAAKREYMKTWRAANKERTKRYNESYWTRKAAELAGGTGDGK